MTEKDEQQHILKAIERLIAGEPVDEAAIPDETQKRLVELARELREQRPRPSDAFEKQLLDKIALSGKEEIPDAEPAKQERARGSRSWLPGWATLPRAAAVAAALILGLVTAGLTAAIINGGGPGGVADRDLTENNNAIVSDDQYGVLDSMSARDQASGGMSGESSQASPAASPIAPGEASSAGPGNLGGSSGTAVIPGVRQVIQTADYEIEIAAGEFQQKYDQVTDLAARYGGYVASANTAASSEEDSIQRGTITIRIADTGDNFTTAMAELDGMGRVVSRKVSGQDVTEEYVDLQSRLKNAQAHEASLLELMAKAQTIDEMLTVESQLNSVRSEIEQLQGQINYLDNRTDYASITIDMYEEDAASQTDDGSATDWGFLNALRYAGWLAVQTVNFVIMALGVIIPVALIMTLVLIVSYRLLQRRRPKS